MILLSTLLALSVAVAAEPHIQATVTPIPVSTVAKGASRVGVLDVTVAASCSLPQEASLNVITVELMGLGNAADVLGVYALDGNTRLTRRAALERRTREADVRFRGVRLKPCEKKTVRIAVDIASDALSASELRFQVAGIGVTSRLQGIPVSISLNAPPSTPTRIAPVRSDPPTFTRRELRQRIVYGGQRVVARFLLSANADAVDVTAITLTNHGKARDADLQNISVVYASGKPVSNVLASLNGDRARFVFDPPLRLERNQERLFEVKADFRVSVRQTVRLELEEESDIEWTDPVR